ncbi:G5 domain-containing protein [Micromonospora sp. WMMD980]|uniref:G5 domain-containing protein n=1 Tax=Micromonospora sp. WMMD980 TaxID=3016088 RepID=UPI00241652FA|nr:G5 domain-containing protein [Micromonospora sp. WMMD980]MDG4803045.1 G5 domain-containing protein [Micromonospora sp. WMMD980]
MTYPSPAPAGSAHPTPQQSRWRRLSGGAKVAVVSAGVLVLCCCGGVAIGAGSDSPAAPGKKGAAPATSATRTVEAAAPAPAIVDPTASAPAPPASPPESSRSASPPPQVQIRTVSSTTRIAYPTRTVKDATLARGTKKVRIRGVAGVRTLTYQVTVTDGVQTAKKLIRSVVTRQPVAQVVAVGTKQTRSCDPNYSGACVPIASDVDCSGGSGNGPAYVDGPVRVIGSDIYDLDRDGDGIGCDD